MHNRTNGNFCHFTKKPLPLSHIWCVLHFKCKFIAKFRPSIHINQATFNWTHSFHPKRTQLIPNTETYWINVVFFMSQGLYANIAWHENGDKKCSAPNIEDEFSHLFHSPADLHLIYLLFETHRCPGLKFFWWFYRQVQMGWSVSVYREWNESRLLIKISTGA